MKRALVSLAFLFVVACNNPTSVGSPCTVNGDCDFGHYCNTAAPGGMCTHGCSFDGARLSECPEGAICTDIATNSQVCAATCTSNANCRDKYECVAASGSTLKACKPKS